MKSKKTRKNSPNFKSNGENPKWIFSLALWGGYPHQGR